MPTRSFDDVGPGTGGGSGIDEALSPGNKGKDREPPQSAIDFYEAAVERETSGKLGDSLQLYRKAFRMDSRVDEIYRKKHFAAAWRAKPPPPPPAASSASASGRNQASSEAQPAPAPAPPPPTLPELIASFAGTSIEGVPAEVEGTPAPPCPLAALPDEILVHVLRDVAAADVGDLARLARVCRRLAYLVATEEGIWRRVCLGPEFGFPGMHHRFQRGVAWDALELPPDPSSPAGSDDDLGLGGLVLGDATEAEQRQRQRAAEEAQKLAVCAALAAPGGAYGGSWRAMFRSRPRVRFGGCYISTVNYIRAGQASVHQVAWNTPVHIVTYYRYLRLFRDGTALSLLTTDEPAHVVPQ